MQLTQNEMKNNNTQNSKSELIFHLWPPPSDRPCMSHFQSYTSLSPCTLHIANENYQQKITAKFYVILSVVDPKFICSGSALQKLSDPDLTEI
jgi:hypothetical protein